MAFLPRQVPFPSLAQAYLPQASTDSQMETMGLSEHAIYQDMQQEAKHGKA